MSETDQRCPRCKGEGYLEVTVYWHAPMRADHTLEDELDKTNGDPVSLKRSCPACQGRGWV
jgi:DnaJ-class molecular chaperone